MVGVPCGLLFLFLSTLLRRMKRILSSQSKRKIRNTQMGIPCCIKEKNKFEPYSLRASNAQRLALCAMLRFCATLAEQLCLPRWKASFPTRLRCVICAVAHYVSCGAKGENPFFSVIKRKIPSVRKDTRYLWRRRKDLNLRAGCPTYTLSRGASSPLEYFSIRKCGCFLLPMYYIKDFLLCQ